VRLDIEPDLIHGAIIVCPGRLQAVGFKTIKKRYRFYIFRVKFCHFRYYQKFNIRSCSIYNSVWRRENTI